MAQKQHKDKILSHSNELFFEDRLICYEDTRFGGTNSKKAFFAL